MDIHTDFRALSDKMVLVRIVENVKLILILVQGRLSKGYLCPAGLRKGI